MGELNSWLLKETKGVKILDKCVLYSLKVIYLGLRILLRIALGKREETEYSLNKDLILILSCIKYSRF